mmetsp:Transcript_18519/g.16403  ORF Transcript_18519/g.16403 Transcript_18519/m.16403 type:complete len:89 (+) Transcript_18519:19-285(+)
MKQYSLDIGNAAVNMTKLKRDKIRARLCGKDMLVFREEESRNLKLKGLVVPQSMIFKNGNGNKNAIFSFKGLHISPQSSHKRPNSTLK